MKRRAKKVAILGSAGGWSRAPFDQAGWEIWGLNDQYRLLTDDHQRLRADRWFELHPNSVLTKRRRPLDHQAQLAAMKIPVYTLFPGNPWTVKHPRPYPYQRAVKIGRDYFACTFAYQIALALIEGFEEIRLYGTPLVSAREALVERPCVEWWIGLAEGRGVTVSADHDEPMGLMRQSFAYALHDQEERRAAAAFVAWHQVSCQQWLFTEAERILGRSSGYTPQVRP